MRPPRPVPQDPDTAGALDGVAVLRHAITHAFPGQIAVVSSFGAESAVLLALVADIDRAIPVLFLDTGKHFAQTLAYRRDLVAALGLTDVRDLRPEAAALQTQDPDGLLAGFDADACCTLRKTTPLNQALAPFAAWVTGRKRYQGATRSALPLFELAEGKVKINPLAGWSAAEIAAEMDRRDLPRHPMVAQGYPSIGCVGCTWQVAPGADPRSGRWAGLAKTECGIHLPPSARAA